MYCENCWEMIPEGAKFCRFCGAPVKMADENTNMGQAQYARQGGYQEPVGRIKQVQPMEQYVKNTYEQPDVGAECDEDTDPRWSIPVIVFSIISVVIGILLITIYRMGISSWFYALTCLSLPAVFIPPTKRKPMLTMIPVSLFYISLLVPWMMNMDGMFGRHIIIAVGLIIAIIIPQIFQFFFIKNRKTFLFAFMILSGILSVPSHIADAYFWGGIIYHIFVYVGLMLADGSLLIKRHYEDYAYDENGTAFYSLFCPNCGARFADDGGVRFCNRCAAPLKWLDRPEPMPYAGENPFYYEDYPSFGIAFLSFLFPTIGLIIYIVWHPFIPRKAASAGKGTLIGFIVYVIGVVVTYGIILGWFK